MAAGTRSSNRFLRLALTVLALAAALTFPPLPKEGASAQELIRRQGFFEQLFGGPPRRENLPPPPRVERAAPQQPSRRRVAMPPATRQRQARQAAPAAPAAAPVEVAEEKLENARVILVVGDFMASGVAEGLETAYAESPGVRVVDRSNGSSGFVRDDYYDWNGEIGPILEEVDPAAVVVMIGSNDRQQLVVDGRREAPQTEPWLKEYTSRVTGFAETIAAAGIPIIWTGLPPFKSSSMSSDMLAFNDIHKQAVEAAGGTFVDIWEGFVDENGAFVFTGPDMNGQAVRLRGSDGINLTRPAKRKIAFYAEKPLNKILGAAVAPDVERLDIQNLPEPGPVAVDPASIDRTGPVSLASPDLDGGTDLMGAAPVKPDTASHRDAPKRPGRADDFSLRRMPDAPTDEGTTSAITP